MNTSAAWSSRNHGGRTASAELAHVIGHRDGGGSITRVEYALAACDRTLDGTLAPTVETGKWITALK